MRRTLSTALISSFAAIAAIASLLPANAQQNSAPPLQPSSATAAPQTTPTPVLPPGALPSPAGSSATVTIGKKTKATPAPPKDTDANRVGVTGVWEIALQKPDGVVYTHFKLTQTGTTLTGQYLDEKGKHFPLAGTIDGKKVRVVVTLADGTALVFSGSEDAYTDMVGTLSTTSDLIGFTAAYRPKYKWIDSVGPGMGGMGNPYP